MPGMLDWDSLVTGSVYTTSVVNGVSVTLTVAPLASPPTTLLATNRTIRASPNGSFNQKALQFQQLPNAIGIGQDVTFTFGAPVSNVVFTFYDIDNLVGGWGDRIRMFTAGYTSASSGTVIGNGTVGNLFGNSQLNNNATDGSNAGNLTLTCAGPITSFAFRYTNAVNVGGGNQRIGVSDMSWTC